ncbi:hypothetical protein GCM10010528_04810 [Gordonia defluvii]|uniref:DUF8020 domain-containing protein n=1 Tax=Gordonia defluvii TaxID=283718 RepID=A0ABN3YDA6_9ACTN|nr:hypothetical protein [Gordonia sp. UBA5067]
MTSLLRGRVAMLALATFTVAILTIVAEVSVVAGQVQAAPDRPGPVRATVQRNADTVTVTVHNGSLAVTGGRLVVRNTAGRVVESAPLRLAGPRNEGYQIAASVIHRTATLTPPIAARMAYRQQYQQVDRRIVGPRTKQERDDQAFARMVQEMSAAMTLSSLVGLAIGFVVGLLFGGVLGCIALLFVGCLPGVLVASIPFAVAGSIVGILIGGGGGAIAAIGTYLDTINKPFKPQYQDVPR